ncbi:methyl-accepting chemotaxis protein, partial [Clostridium perfringens]
GYLLTGDSTFADSLKVKQESVAKLMAETKGLMTAEEDQKVFNEIETGYVIYTEAVTEVLNKLGYDTGFFKAVPFRVYEAAFSKEREVRNSFSTLIAQFTVHKNEDLAKQADQIADSSRFQNMVIMLIGIAG